MSSPTNQQTPPPTNSPGPIAQQLVQLQGSGQTPPNPPQPTTIPGKTPNKKKGKPWKEVREWLNIVGILLIPLLIGVYTLANTIQQTSLAQQNRQADVANQLDQQRETALKTYEDDISSLLLDRHLATSRPTDEVRTIALAKTLEVLHQLDGPRNARAIQFLRDAQLIGINPLAKTDYNIIDFSNADLTGDDLSGANLGGTHLNGADLSGVHLSYADLNRAGLYATNLSRADLSEADLIQADLRWANLSSTDLSGADLRETDLNRAFLNGADLYGANLNRAFLNGADLTRANLTRANLTGADLSGAILPDGTRHSCRQGEKIFCQ
jgi:uncharacterized protein YjbI with pentapeptide repeats